MKKTVMTSYRLQQGMTIWTFLLIFVMAALIVWVGFKLMPAYMDYFSVRSSLENVSKQPDIGNASKEEITKLLYNRFVFNGVDEVVDVRKNVKMEDTAFGREVTIEYLEPVTLIDNQMHKIDVVITFKTSVTLKR